MLYLFGRLALSDSFYFNQDLHADEQPETLAAQRQPEASRRATRPGAQGPHPRRGSVQPLAAPPAAETAS